MSLYMDALSRSCTCYVYVCETSCKSVQSAPRLISASILVLHCRLTDTSPDNEDLRHSEYILTRVMPCGASLDGEYKRYLEAVGAGKRNDYNFPIHRDLLTGVLGKAYCSAGCGAFWEVLASLSALQSLVTSCAPLEELTQKPLTQQWLRILPTSLKKVLEDPVLCQVLPLLLVGVHAYLPVPPGDDDGVRREVSTDMPLGVVWDAISCRMV